jgi:hypothetical protein
MLTPLKIILTHYIHNRNIYIYILVNRDTSIYIYLEKDQYRYFNVMDADV